MEVRPEGECEGEPATVLAAPGEPIQGTEGDDVIVGTPGADTIKAGSGKDTLRGGPGKDQLNGGGKDRERR